MTVNQYAINIDYQTTIDGLSLKHSQRLRVALADPNSPPTIGDAPNTINPWSASFMVETRTVSDRLRAPNFRS